MQSSSAVSGNTATWNGQDGIYTIGNNAIVTPDNTIHDNSRYGLYVIGDNINLNGFNIYNNVQDGIYAPGHNVNITGSTLTDNGGNGISLTGNWAYIVGNTIINKGNIGISVIGAWVFVSNNIISNSIADGISVLGDNAVVTWNTVTNSKKDGISVNGNYASVSNNTVSGNNEDGIVVNGYAATIMSNYVTSQIQGNGITVIGNNSWISQNIAEYNGNNGIFINGNHATVYENTVNNNGSPVHSILNIPQFVKDQNAENVAYWVNYYNGLIDDCFTQLSNQTWVGEYISDFVAYFSSLASEFAASSEMEDYYSVLNSLYGGGVESKLLSLGGHGNGIEVSGDFVSISNTHANNNEGYGIFVTGDDTNIENNPQITGNGGGIAIIGTNTHLRSSTANENEWVGIYVNSDRSEYYRQSFIDDCTTENNGIGIVASGVIYVAHCHANHNKLDGILAIGELSAGGDPLSLAISELSNGLYSNEVNDNGGNGTYSYGNNAMALNYGDGNALVGIMVCGNPFILAPPNSVTGYYGIQFPLTFQLIQIATYADSTYAIETGAIKLNGLIDCIGDRTAEYLSTLQSYIPNP